MDDKLACQEGYNVQDGKKNLYTGPEERGRVVQSGKQKLFGAARE